MMYKFVGGIFAIILTVAALVALGALVAASLWIATTTGRT
jgi:hypothetical protein